MSVYQENLILDQIFHDGNPSISIHDGDPAGVGSNEILVPRQQPGFDVAALGKTQNTNAIDYAGMPAVTVTHVGVWDVNGHFVWDAPLTTPEPVNAGNTFRINAGDLVIEGVS